MSIFTQSQSPKIPKSKFDLTHEKKLSMKMGVLTPILLQEVLPSDTFKVNSQIFMRLAPMLAPIMHRVNVYTHYFFVPNRIIWDEWEDFITGGADGTAAPIHPYMILDNSSAPYFGVKTLGDYFGIPELGAVVDPTIPQNINALPFRGMAEIFNEFYRDQTLTPKIAYLKSSGQIPNLEIQELTKLRNRAWEKDYFTSALPWPQRGPSVPLPTNEINRVVKFDTHAPVGTEANVRAGTNANIVDEFGGRLAMGSNGVDGLSTINDLRRAESLQKWLERNARGGARYIEQLLAHFGKSPSDARLQRPEYLGGGKQPIVISEVLSTYDNTAGGLPQGEMTGHGISVGQTNGFKKTFEEHGFVFGIMSVLPKTAYMNGLNKMWDRPTKLDYAWPEFANIGEQAIKNKELFYDGIVATSGDPEGTFGYTPRYAEYKYGVSTVHGDFKNTLDYWHMSRKFANLPVLNDQFIQSDPTKRIFAVEDADSDDLYVQVLHSIDALRPLPYFGTPSI
jgi:hypothetical protein